MIIYINILLLCIMILPKINIINVSNSSPGIRIEDILIVIYMLLYITTIKNGKFKIVSKDMGKILKIFFVYFLCALISSIYGILNEWVSPMMSFLYLIRKVEYFCMIFIGFDYMKMYKNFDKLIEKVDFIVIFHFIFSILQLKGLIGSYNGGVALQTLTQGRVSSTFNGAYEFSAFLLLFLPVYLNKIFNLKKYKLKDIILILMILYDIFISESRSSLLVSAFIILIMILKVKKVDAKKLTKIMFFILLLIMTIVIIISIGNISFKRFENLGISSFIKIIKITWENKSFDSYLNNGNWYGFSRYSLTEISNMNMDASIYARVSHWMQMIDGWIKSPIIGLGISISGTAADGNYIRILCESGILGFIMWCNLLIYIYITVKDEENTTKVISKYALISIIIGALLIDLFEASKIMMTFWFMLGLSYSYTYVKDMKTEGRNSK